MNALVLLTMIRTEVRLRSRRLSSLVTLLLVAASAWLMFPDPQSGQTFIAIAGAQVRNTSMTIALGSACMFSLNFGLAGFYLTRGRSAEDLHYGVGSVIGASAVGNAVLLAGRWAGNVVYLLTMALAYLLSVLVCHVLRGVGPIEPGVYLEVYAMFLVPVICFAVSFALLFDSVPALMGKLGDGIYFIIWIAQFSIIVSMADHQPLHWHSVDLFDFSGIEIVMKVLQSMVHTDEIAFGMTDFNPHLAAITLLNDLLPAEALTMRAATAAMALLVAVPALFLFHRYSADQVRATHAARRRSPVQMLNRVVHPLTSAVQPVYELAAHAHGSCAGVLAEVALTLNAAPWAIAALPVIVLCSIFMHYAALHIVLGVAVACWGVLVSDIATRDFAADCEDLTGVLSGGSAGRYVRQCMATFLLGVLFCAVLAVRVAFQDFFLAVALLVGLASLSALASLFGRLARTPRLFLSLFMFWLYVATQVPNEAMLDVVGFNGVADGISVLVQCGLGIVATGTGYWVSRMTR